MARRFVAVLALFVATAFAVPALADQGTFPMAAAEFKEHVEARIAKARSHLETRIAERNLTPEEATARRAKFDAGVGIVNAEVAKAVADGTVTEEEANAVREVAKALHGHHGHGHKHAENQ